ncbi:hypothetical protein D1007_09979 [Hordeum vulgare]|nr:hypothetical protein D1007_09979 [Hordeum vulgare]
MTDKHIDYLQRMLNLPFAELVEACVPGGERVIFGTHFLVGFGLPGSTFLRQLLDLYVLQMHHVGPNTVLYLACFAMCYCNKSPSNGARKTC